MVQLNKHDLQFILKQIEIAEAHADGTPLTELVDSSLLPYGLRTVDGSYNNFGIGRENWGASGDPFPGLTTPYWREGSGSLGGAPYPTNNDYGETGDVVDAEPRLISNLIVDQTPDNPAVIMAALQHAGFEGDFQAAVATIQGGYQQIKQMIAAVDGDLDAPVLGPFTLRQAIETYQANVATFGVELDGLTVHLPNVSPDEGLSASYNSFFTLFGQFFDHGLDLVAKGGNGTVYMPLSPDDPLYNPDSPHTNFMVMTRATVGEGAGNVTTPWVDQNQTYTSHPSHQVFLREYQLVDGVPLATGRLLNGERGLATWADVKAQARDVLGIELTDKDVGSVPVVAVDPYGEFIRGANGLPQLVVGNNPDGSLILLEGNLDNPVDPSAVGAARAGVAFLDDIAHNAVPVRGPDGELVPSLDGNIIRDARGNLMNYDPDLLDAHYITGDGRGNENIGLSTIHHVFHSEHNQQVEKIKATVLEAAAEGDIAFLNEWLLNDVSAGFDPSSLQWDGERLFQAARFSTEMQYQHLVFEEFARKIQPDIDIFIVQPDAELNPAIFAEFANVVYRFGHSMLNETVDRINADGTRDDIDLFDAFLNPLAFGSDTVNHNEAAAAIVRGMTAQVGNEIDEFVTNTLRNQLVGIALDLPAINIARGRDTGMPTLNEARAQFMEMAGGDTQLKPYDSWADFALNLKNPASIINFIAAYGTHDSILAATTIADKRAAAFDIVMGGGAISDEDRMAFLNAPAATSGVNDIDLWIGGLAEKKMAFGGMLGSTFAFVFEMQLENLQDADRFYYLSRTQGLNLLSELENNSLAKMVLRNTTLGQEGFALPADVFSTPDHILYVDHGKQMQMTGVDDPQHSDPTLGAFTKLVERRDTDGDGIDDYIRFNGLDHVVIAGTEGNDHIIAGGGDDTVWGLGGDDRIEAGYGVDHVDGGDGDDIITNSGTDIGEVDMLKGGAGNDVIHGGSGMALIFGNDGHDFLMTGPDGSEIRGGEGNDFILGGDGPDMLFGNEGDDWIEGKGRFEYIAGDNGELFFNSTIIGHDVLNGGAGDTDYDADSGDDIMVGGEGIQKFIGMWGHDWVTYKGQQVGADADMNFPMFPNLPLEVLRDRFSQVEGLSGWMHDDILRGDDRTFNDAFEFETETGTEDDEVEQEDDEDDVVTPGFTIIEVKAEEKPDVYDPTPEGNFVHNELDRAGRDRIDGLDRIITDDMFRQVEYWADGSGEIKDAFVGGNILLGGGGSDLFEGRGGDDVIDGDAWLNVRISIRNAAGVEIATAEGMDARVYGPNGALLHNGRSLASLMLDRVYNPAQLHIVREILYDSTGVDTASYWDVMDNYQLDGTSDGRLVVKHLLSTETDGEDGNEPNPFDPITGQNRVSDGRDILANIEFLQFGDGLVSIRNGTSANNIISGSGGNDIILGMDGNDRLDGGSGADVLIGGRGNDTLNGGSGNDRLIGGLGDDALNGQTGNDTYVFGLADGNDTITEASGNGSADRIIIQTDGGALNSLRAHDTNGGSNNGNLVIEYNGNQITVSGHYSGTNAQTGVEFINFDGGSIGGYNLGLEDYQISKSDSGSTRNGTSGNDFIAGENGVADTMNGGAGNDIMFGGTGDDMLTGGAGDDLLVGGAGDDRYAGEAGDDTFLWRVGDGVDRIDGGTDYDTVHITGDDSAEHYHILTRSEAQARGISVFGDTEIVITRNGLNTGSVIARLDNVEHVVINGMGGGDNFSTYGNFGETSLSHNTITLEGSDDDDIVDISQLTSAHRVYFRSNGGNDTILGALRPQDVIELPKGAKASDYQLVENEDGTTSFTNGDHTITFTRGEGVPQLEDGEEVPPPSGNEDTQDPSDSDQPDDTHDGDDDDHGHDEDDDDDCEVDEETAQPPATGSGGNLTGTSGADALTGTSAGETIMGLGGNDVIFGGDGNDNILGGDGNDMLYGDAGNDRIFGDNGNDLINAGAGEDTVFGGDGNDTIVAEKGDGDDTYYGGSGSDTLDMSAITANITANLGTSASGRGTVTSAQTGNDTIWEIENFIGGWGDDTITASRAVNVLEGGEGQDTFRFLSAADANGDTIGDFQPGDKIDLSAIDANNCAGGNQSFTIVSDGLSGARGELMIRQEDRDGESYTVVEGNTSGGGTADFKISIKGSHDLTADDFHL